MIRLTNVSKTFTRHMRTAPRSLKEWFVHLGAWQAAAKERADAKTLWALRDVSVTVRPGEMLGVIGANGAGKSTLLRLIGGVLSPDGGTVEVGGRIGGLLSLDTGFSDDLTGRENVYTSGVVAGLTRREVTERMEAIVAFAELAHAIDAPLRTYSTGMRLRLGFAVAVHTDPDVLLIDEALSVGDLAFQQKCLARIKTYQARGCALVLVSHSPAQVRQLCDTVLWLRQGRAVACGPPDVVTGQYESEMMAETQRRLPASHPAASRNGTARGDGAPEGHPALVLNETRFGSLEATIDAVRLLDKTGQATDVVPSGHPLAVEIDYRAPAPIPDPIFSVTLQQADGTDVLDVNTQAEQIPLPRLKGRGTLRMELDRIDAGPGQYYVNVGMYAAGWHYAYDFHWQTYPVCVTGGLPAASSWSPPRRWHILTPPPADAAPDRASP